MPLSALCHLYAPRQDEREQHLDVPEQPACHCRLGAGPVARWPWILMPVIFCAATEVSGPGTPANIAVRRSEGLFKLVPEHNSLSATRSAVVYATGTGEDSRETTGMMRAEIPRTLRPQQITLQADYL
jgi:hypothetical protein